MTAADESRVVWRHEGGQQDDDLRRALEQVLDRHDPEGDGYAKFGGDALLRDVQAALAARSEPRADGLRLALMREIYALGYKMDGGTEVIARSQVARVVNEVLAATPPAEALPHKMYAGGPDCPCPGSGSVYHHWFNEGRTVGMHDAAVAAEQPE